MASIQNRPAGSGRSQPDTLRRHDPSEEHRRPKHYCHKCRGLRETTIIRGYNGARDHHRCETCDRTWPR